MADTTTLDCSALGARLLTPPGGVDARWVAGAPSLVRVVHEKDLRDGTFLGFGEAGDPTALQHWGRLWPTWSPHADLKLPAGRRTPVPGTAGALVHADLSTLSGLLCAPDVPGIEERRLEQAGTWHLVMVDHQFDLSGQVQVLLSYRWQDPRADRGIFAPYYFRVATGPDCPMVPVGPVAR